MPRKRGAPAPNRDNETDPYGPASPPPRYQWGATLDAELDKREHRTIEEEAA